MRQAVQQERQAKKEQMQQSMISGLGSGGVRTLSRSRNPSRERTPAEVGSAKTIRICVRDLIIVSRFSASTVSECLATNGDQWTRQDPTQPAERAWLATLPYLFPFQLVVNLKEIFYSFQSIRPLHHIFHITFLSIRFAHTAPP